jgi:excisionase family DNA binding protein
MPVLNGYFNIAEAAAFLGLHPETIKRLCRSGRLPAEKVNNAWLIHIEQLKRFKVSYRENRGRRPQTRCLITEEQLTSEATHA